MSGPAQFDTKGSWIAGFSERSASVGYRSSRWNYGLSYDDKSYLGAKPSGAFGQGLRSGFSWITRTVEQPMGTLSVKATGTLALGSPWYERVRSFGRLRT